MSDRIYSNEINENPPNEINKTPAGATTEHSRDFQETFEAEEYDDKSDPYLDPQFLQSLRNFQPAPCLMIQGIRRPRPENETPGYSGIDAKRSRNDTFLSDPGISPTSMPVQTSHGEKYFTTPAGATEHSQDFQETFEAEEDDDKSDLHGEYCSTNRSVVLDLGKDKEQSEKLIQMTDPVTQIVFEIKASQLSQMLQKNGKLKSKYNVNSNEIKHIKEKFCMAETLLYVTKEEVQMLQNAGVQIVSVTNRDPQPSHPSNPLESPLKPHKGSFEK